MRRWLAMRLYDLGFTFMTWGFMVKAKVNRAQAVELMGELWDRERSRSRPARDADLPDVPQGSRPPGQPA